jgi:hypothetical protein
MNTNTVVARVAQAAASLVIVVTEVLMFQFGHYL